MKPWRRRLASLDRRARIALAGVALLVVAILFAACGGCNKRPSAAGATTPSSDVADAGTSPEDAGNALTLMWGAAAREGDVGSLSVLAVHEGALGLVEAASDPELRPTAIRAMAYARGWAQLPFLAKAAASKDDDAAAALASVVEIATRPRVSEDPEDAEELRDGCEGLTAIARDAAQKRPSRVAAIRAVRMLPCPPAKPNEELPTDLDTK